MKKIITAINNPKLNEELKKEKKFEIVGKDIQYKEAILEILEKNNSIDLIIISEKILGEINIENLIKKIKLLNEKIKIIYILEKENNEIEKILIRNKIFDFYYNNKINLNELIKIINKKEINMEEEIIKLRKIIEEKSNKNCNIEYKEAKEQKKLKSDFIDKNINKFVNKKKRKKKNITSSIISFSGDYKTGKSTLALIISQYLAEKGYKIFLIDGDLEKQDLKKIMIQKKIKKLKRANKKHKLKRIFCYKIIKIKLINNRESIYYYKIKSQIKISIIKINKNFYFYYNLKNLLNEINMKKEKYFTGIICNFFKNLKQNYDFIIIDLSKNNNEKINKEILEKSNFNFVCIEANILGVRECKKIIKKYINQWKINKNNLYIIKNKNNFISVNSNLIAKSIPIKNKFFEIKERKYYSIFYNKYFKNKVLLKNKNIKKELNRIINKIIYSNKYIN